MRTYQVRNAWAAWRCINYSTVGDKSRVVLFGRYAGLAPTPFVTAYDALELTLTAVGYLPESNAIMRNCPAGIGGKPCQTDGDDCSLHNFGLAIDLDPWAKGNPYFYGKPFGQGWDFTDTKLQRVHVEAVEAIRTNDGHQVFRWLGWSIGDTMHFQADCTPAQIATGIDPSTILGGGDLPPTMPEGGTMNYVKYRDGFGTAGGDPDVRYWQRLLVKLGQDTGGVDGKYGDKSVAAVTAVVAGSDGQQIFDVEAAGIHIALGLLGTGGDDLYAPLHHSHSGQVTVA